MSNFKAQMSNQTPMKAFSFHPAKGGVVAKATKCQSFYTLDFELDLAFGFFWFWR